MSRRDIHIHFGDVAVGSTIDPHWNLQGDAKKAMEKTIGRRIHTTKPATTEDMRERIHAEGLTQICLYCDHKDYLAKGAAELATIAEVTPIYWERDWDNPQIPPFAKGIKIHPVIEGKDATVDNLRKIMAVAQERQIPVLFHTEDENPGRSRGTLMAQLAEAYPDVTIVALHSGAYGPPQLLNVPAYKQDLQALVAEMIDAAATHPNIYLETSCLAFPEKAQLLYEATRQHPELLERIVIGSDFPILEQYPDLKLHNSFSQQETILKSAGFTDGDIAKFYDNVRKAAPPLTQQELAMMHARGYVRTDFELA